MHFNVNFNVIFKLIKVHLLVSELCSYIFCLVNLFVICVIQQVVHCCPSTLQSYVGAFFETTRNVFFAYCNFLQFEILLVVFVVHVVALSSIADCTTDGREVYFYRP